jgi:heptosyltransferase III
MIAAGTEQNILFITGNRIGDAILSTGLLRHLHETYPAAKITIVCGPLCVDLFEAVPNLAAIIPLKKQSWNRHWLKLLLQLWPQRWDMIIDLRNSVVSRLLRHEHLHVWRRDQQERHKVIENAAVLGLSPPPDPIVWVSEARRREAAALLPQGNLIALAPAANWPPKQWPAESFAKLALALMAEPECKDTRFLILAAVHEAEQIKPLLEALPPERIILRLGESLALAAACLSQARLFIGNDSGLMHLAGAVGIPVIGLFGPGYEKIYGPWGAKTRIVRTPESTAELLSRLPQPSAHAPNLMQSLSVETVLQAAKAMLKA